MDCIMKFLPLLILFGEATATEPELVDSQFTVSSICDVDYGLSLYNLTETSLLQCCAACSDEVTCQSVTYDVIKRECRLSAAEALNPITTGCDKVVAYAKFSTEEQYAGCTHDAQCKDEYQYCDIQSGQCICTWGFRYNPRDNTCSPGCANYGNEFQEIDNVRLGRHNDNTYNGTMDEAKEMCLAETSFTCISLDCYKHGAFCEASKDSIVTQIGSMVLDDQDYTYFQRKCA